MNKVLKVFVGNRFGRLVFKEIASLINGRKYGIFLCDCGVEKKIRISHVTCGATQSCGCLHKERARAANIIHGDKARIDMHGNTRFYNIWAKMKDRCKHRYDKNYGGRGITVCERWKDYVSFKKDMFKSYNLHVKQYGEKNTQIDRINNDKGYSKDNCRWATRIEQANNKRNIISIFYKNKCYTSRAALCREFNIKYTHFNWRMQEQVWKEQDLIDYLLTRNNSLYA